MKTKKFYLLIKSAHNYTRVEEVEDGLTLDEFKELIINVARGYHCDFDSVKLISSPCSIENKHARVEKHPASGSRGYNTVNYLSCEDDDGCPVDYTEESQNLLYTGINCDDGVTAVYDDNGDVACYIIDGCGEEYESVEDALEALTLEDFCGEIEEAYYIARGENIIEL